MNKVRKNSLIILAITIVLLTYIMKDNFFDIINALKGCNFLYLGLTLIVFIVSFLLEQGVLYIIAKTYKKDMKFSFICNLGIITKFFNGITPLATGGQPLQVYYFSKNKVNATTGTNIIIQNYIAFQVGLVFISTLFIILNSVFNMMSAESLLFKMTILGYIINVCILAFLLFVGFSKKFSKSIVFGVIKFLKEIKVIKNYEEVSTKWEEICNNYNKNAMMLLKNKKNLVLCILFQILCQILNYSLPFFVALTLNNVGTLNIVNATVAGCLIYVMGCYIPIPGATGGMEYGFIGYIGNFVTKPDVFAQSLIWRFITYYLPTIVGGIVFNIKIDNKGKELIK